MNGTIRFEEEFTISQLSERNNDLIEAVRNWDEVVVDMSEVQRMDVAAMQLLIAAKKECDTLGHKLTMVNSDVLEGMLLSIGAKL